MVAMRKAVVLLGLLALAALSSGVAQAQGTGLVACTATAVPPVVRAEGIAELVGDIILNCTNPSGATPPAATFMVNVGVSLNVNVTNNINFGEVTDEAGPVSDAVLIINENNCTTPTPEGNTYDACAGTNDDYQDPQYGVLTANNRLDWNGVAVPFPGATDGAVTNPDTTTIRVSAMRGNASQLGVPDSATFPSTQITAFVSITGPTTVSVTNNVLNVAVPILGLIVEPGDALTGLQCVDQAGFSSIELQEGFATAFKTLGVPTFSPGTTQWESGYYTPGSNNGGGASQGTRFIMRFFNTPDGIDISVPAQINNGDETITGDALWLVAVIGANADGEGGSLSSGAPTDTVDITLSGGFGAAVYEVVDGDPFRVENIDVPLFVSSEADTANDLPAVGSGQINVSFAPLSTVTTASGPEPEPRFIDNAGDPDDFVSVIRCTTTLLFPFVTNQAGFDTGVAISNTSQDWLGTDPQAGACTLHYHGTTTGGGAAMSEETSTVIAGGEQLVFTLSGGNPGQGIAGVPEFQGYMIAVCEFQYGHGFAFITDGFGGVRALAQGYLALVIPVTPAGRLPGVPFGDVGGALHRFGEALNH